MALCILGNHKDRITIFVTEPVEDGDSEERNGARGRFSFAFA